MTLVELLLVLVIAGVCGFVAEMVVGFSPGGFLASIAVGLVGAYLGSWIATMIGLPPVLSTRSIIPATNGSAIIPINISFDVVYSIIGAIVLLFLISLARRSGRRRRSYR